MIFIDANFIIAYYVENHVHHSRALEIWEDIKNKEKVISNLVIAEVTTVLNIKLNANKELIQKAYNKMNEEFTVLEDAYLFNNGLKKLISYHPERLPLFDCVYMAIMEYLGIKEIITFDDHFDINPAIKRIY